MKITLVQPRHCYAPSFKVKKHGHIYLPTSLLAAAAIFLELGLEVEFIDENIDEITYTNNIFGINLLGAPYIPTAVEFEKRLNNEFGKDYKLFIGGQIVSGLLPEQLNILFTSNVTNGNSIENVLHSLGIKVPTIPKIENLSLQNAYNLINDENWRLYLSGEISFYLSQGCKYSCSFCSAKRTLVKPNRIKMEEMYRDISLAVDDLEYLIIKALKLNKSKLDIYLSNLDLFQSPAKLDIFATGVINLKNKYKGFSLNFRGLSTVNSFLLTHEKYNSIIEKIVAAGLYQVGFGVDGATAKVYKHTRKPQVVEDCLKAIEISSKIYGITPETLMVFGHNNAEDEKSLEEAYNLSLYLNKEYGAIPRPHVSKDIVPGNDGWFDDANKAMRDTFLENPILFQNLDFTALPSPITHPDKKFRELVTKYYKLVCVIPGSLTQYVMPISPQMNNIELANAISHNLEKYDL